MGEHGQGDVPVPAVVATHFVLAQTALVLGSLEALLDRPPAAGDVAAERRAGLRDRYRILGSKRDQVRQLGDALTSNAAEVLLCVLVECITGQEIDRYALAA